MPEETKMKEEKNNQTAESQNLQNENESFREHLQPEFMEDSAKPDPVQRFRRDVRNKLDSFEDPQEKLDFIVKFQSTMNTLQNGNTYVKAWSEVLLDQFLPKCENGSLNREEFEKRMNEVCLWQIQKNVEIGHMVDMLGNTHSADWIANKVFTTRQGQMFYSMRDDVLTFGVMSRSEFQDAVEQNYQVSSPVDFWGQSYDRVFRSQEPEIKLLAEKGRCYSNGNMVKNILDKAIQAAGTEAEKQELIRKKEAWKLRQEELKRREVMPTKDEAFHREMITKKKLWDSMSLDFITDRDVVKEIRKGQEQQLSQEHLKGAHSDFIELIGKTEQALDQQKVVNNAQYQTLRSEMKKLKDSLSMYGASQEHSSEVRNAEEKLVNTCRTYLKSLPQNPSKEAYCRPVVQLMEAARENCQLSRENAWNSSVENFNTFAAELQRRSGQRKGIFGEKKNDSDEYRRVLETVNSLQEGIRYGSMNVAEFRHLSDQVKTSCDAYLSVKNPKTPEGRERYALIQNIWNAASRMSSHYIDKAPQIPSA